MGIELGGQVQYVPSSRPRDGFNPGQSMRSYFGVYPAKLIAFSAHGSSFVMQFEGEGRTDCSALRSRYKTSINKK